MSEEQQASSISDAIGKFVDPYLEKRSSSNTLIIFCLLLVAIPIIGVGVATTRTIMPHSFASPAGLGAPSTRFTCSDGSYIDAVFSQAKVQLALSDGRVLSLPQALSASGARYANADETFVFWNKGTTAFIEERGSRTYDNCAVQ